MSNDPKAQELREQRRLRWMWEQNQRREHERRKKKFMAEFERDRAERLRQGGENNRSDDNRESRDEPSRSHHRERNKSPMVREKQLTFKVEARESDPSRPTLNYQNVVIERRPGSIAGEGSRPIFDRPEIRVNGESWSNFKTYRPSSSERASSSYAPAEEFRTIAVVDPAAESSTVSAPRRTDHRREPAIFEPSSLSSSLSSSICRRFQDISLGDHRVRARSRDSRGPRPSERDDHRRVRRRSRSSSAPRRPESRSIHHSRSPSRSRTSQHHRASDRRRMRSRSPERWHRRRSSRSRSRSPSSRREARVYVPPMPYPFILQPPSMFPMGPFPGSVVNPLPRFAYPPPPPPPTPAPPRHPAPRFNAANPYYRAPYR